MGKLFESLRRPADRPPVRLAAAVALQPAPAEEGRLAEALRPLPISLELPNMPAWPALAEGVAVPFIEVPELIALAPHTEAGPTVVPFRPLARSAAVDWRPTPAPAFDESWKPIAQALIDELQERDARTLLLLPLEDASRMAELTADLSAALASQLRQPILLIDTLRDGESAAGKLRLAASPGWEELLLGLDWPLCVQRSAVAGLDAIVAGNRLAQATPARWAKESGRRLRSLAERYRLLLVASQPWPHSPLGLLLAAETQTVCLAVPAAVVDSPSHQRLLRELQADGRAALGSLVMG